MSLKHSQNKAAPHFPHDYPDCPAGARFQEEQEAEFLDKFRRSAEGRGGKQNIFAARIHRIFRAILCYQFIYVILISHNQYVRQQICWNILPELRSNATDFNLLTETEMILRYDMLF